MFHWLRTKKLDIYCLLETHGKENYEFKKKQWQTQWGYNKAFFSNFNGRKKGVTVLFNNIFSYKVHGFLSDPEGRYIILDMTAFDTRFSLVAIYGPDKDSLEFYASLHRKILDVGNYSIIMCGDFNVIQNYDLICKTTKKLEK